MRKYKHVFLLNDGKYEELSPEQLYDFDRKKQFFCNRYFIPISGSLMEVSRTDYIAFYKNARRIKYINEEAVLHRAIFYNALDTDEYLGEELIKDAQAETTEDNVVRISEIELIHSALKTLETQEKDLIYFIFFKGYTEREYAKSIGLSQKGVNKRKHKIFKKIKVFLKKWYSTG